MTAAKNIGRPRTEAPKLPIYDSMKACAAATGIAVDVQKKAKDAGCDAFQSNRVNLERLLRWMFAERDDQPEIAAGKSMFEHYRGLREKIKHDKEAKLTADKNEVVFGLGKIESVMFAALERAQQELPASLKGCDEQAVFKKIGERVSEIKRELAFKFEQLEKGEQVA